MKYLHLYTIVVLLALVTSAKAQIFPYRYQSPITISSTDENNCMFFDKEGVMWVGTNVGVKSYDGYTVKTYKSDAYSPGILPNNTVRSITEDNDDNLWLGTRNGLVRMNKRTGNFKTFKLPYEDQRIIYTLFTSKDGTVWIGTDGGLSYFNPKDESFYTYNRANTLMMEANGQKRQMFNYSVKSIVEDKNGDLLVGTWSAGLLRLRRGSHTFLRYPQLNAMNSAYSLFFDRYHRLWVGTWGYGVMRIDNPNDFRNPKIFQYPYSTSHFDTYYKIVEDPITHTLWACTREGTCFIDENHPEKGWQMYSQIGNYLLNFNNDIASDGCGNIWLCTQNNGIMQVNTVPSSFKLRTLNEAKAGFPINFVASILATGEDWIWLGLNPYGLALYNRRTGDTYYNKQIPGFGTLKNSTLTTSISDIIQRSNGELWFAVNNYGIIVKPRNGNAYELNTANANYLKENFVNTIFESHDKNLWIGTRNGLSIVYPDNKGYFIDMVEGNHDFTSCDIRHISQDKHRHIWLSTDNEGIIRISGNPKNLKSLKFKQYSLKQGNFPVNDATNCLEDSRGRFWAISSSGGLFLYNKEKDLFEPKNREYHLSADRTFAIEEDNYGNLWLATDKALTYIVWGKDESRPQNITFFTKEDGLNDLLFSANVSYKWGKELFFGSRTSFFSFVPTPNMGQKNHKEAKLVITDLLIDDQSFARLDSTAREGISEETPSYTRHINIPSSVKKFDIEFALLTYGNAKKNMYAYLLEGYDDDWQFCNGERHRASFQNLSAGTYRLHVKATDSYGRWQELPYTITIKVLPPWYASRLAFMAYIVLLILGLFASARWYKERLKTRNSLQMGVILTNITHELLTPLTVISATIYKLKSMAPQYEEDYFVMDSNINRTTRLLRQILEVRKSQAGQLRLLVSRNDLSVFLKNACESIRPMAEHQQVAIHTSFPKGECFAWFDADKVDKILYNLLSNAIKYNNVGGQINVSLSCDKEFATIVVSDNGIGMSKKKLKNLYTRFFDGDYRQQNMPGTGIGLSLTHDLVKLHHGGIFCESEEGKGTTFSLRLPIRKSDYRDSEIDTTGVKCKMDNLAIKQAKEENASSKLNPVHASIFIRKNASKILVVEDNEELLALLLQVLSKNYHVLTAKNGKQALNIIMKEQLDLVVSDVMMPVMDGIELCRRVKGDINYSHIPLIMLTAKITLEAKVEGMESGADVYLEKPFSIQQLHLQIKNLLRMRQNFHKRMSSLNGDLEELQPSEFGLTRQNLQFVERVQQILAENMSDEGFSIDSMAGMMNMSRSSFYRKLKSLTGQSPVDFLKSQRITRAAALLLEGYNITEVSVKVGFSSASYFTKCFKQQFNMLPKEYVKSRQEKQ